MTDELSMAIAAAELTALENVNDARAALDRAAQCLVRLTALREAGAAMAAVPVPWPARANGHDAEPERTRQPVQKIVIDLLKGGDALTPQQLVDAAGGGVLLSSVQSVLRRLLGATVISEAGVPGYYRLNVREPLTPPE